MLGPRYDDQVAEENRFHPSMLSNYLKSLKVRLNFLLIKTLRSLLMFIHMLLFRFKKIGGWWFPLRHLYRVFFFLSFQVFPATHKFPKVLSYRQELCKILQLIHCTKSKNLTLLCYYCCILERCHCQNSDSLSL